MSRKRAGVAGTPRASLRRRLPLGYPVLLGTGALLVLLVLVGAVALTVLLRTWSLDRHLDDGGVPYAGAVAAAALDAKGIANDQRGFLLTGRQEFVDEIGMRTALARRSFDLAVQAAPDPRHRAAIEQARGGFETWISAVQGEIASYKQGQHAVADAAAERDRTLRKAYEESLAAAQSLGTDAIRTGESAEQASFRHGIAALLAIPGLALVGGTVTSVWLVRSIARPLYGLAAVLVP